MRSNICNNLDSFIHIIQLLCHLTRLGFFGEFGAILFVFFCSLVSCHILDSADLKQRNTIMYFPRPDLLRVSLPSLLSSLSVSDPLPVCDRVWGFWLCKAGPRAQVVISHHSHRSALRLPPALVLLSYQTLYSSILTSIYLHLSSSCPCQNGLPYPRPPPYCENTTPYQSFSMLSKHKGS